jgi:hypothetical protein
MAIPGVTTTIRDRFYSVSRPDAPSGPRTVVIARRDTVDGTSNIADLDVVRATNELDVIQAFGDGSDIHRAFIELVSAGTQRIYLVPLPKDTTFNHSTGAVTSTTFGGDVFDAAFAAAEAVRPQIIVPWGRGGSPSEWAATPSTPKFGFYANNSSTVANNWAYKVGLKVKEISENTSPCIAFMGIKPYESTNERMTPGQISTHLTISDVPDLSDADMKAIGPYVVVVAGEVKPVGYNSNGVDFGYSNAAASMASTIGRINSYESSVNKPLYNVESIRYNITRTQQNALSELSINPVIINFNGVAVFGDGTTYVDSSSDYSRITSKRIIDDATSVVRQVCQKFIGQPSNIQVRNSMETAISSGLRGMQILGALLAHDFNVTYVPSQNKAIVDLVLTPAFELKNIEVQVSINL